MKRHLIAIALLAVLAAPASAQLSSQQQRMKDCNTQASGMTGDARKQFMSSCLSGSTAEVKSRTASRASRAATPASPRTRSATNDAASGTVIFPDAVARLFGFGLPGGEAKSEALLCNKAG
jgi:hypothetical protein